MSSLRIWKQGFQYNETAKFIWFKTLTHYTYFCLMSDLNWSKVSSSLVILWGVGDWGQTRDEELPVMTLNQSQVRIVSE